ncbi:carbohydrate porin [Sulfuricurvum sp.]|uniref:maltoporin n=1 Tax=Sulfuricurvum sp. TaxID=2025608 RepID=UPI00262EB294|nr:carbohydrate porin [Sulfuricurvum sp.]MDD2780741.1 carbohydrate porin [Sulfuricurvum sp.]
MKKLALILFSFFVSAFGIDNRIGTVGYARLQTSLNGDKTDVCFKAPGAGSKYRLGNECETWIELGFYDTITFDNGITMHNQLRPVFTGPNNRDIEYLRLDEAYTELSGIFDNSVSFWAGRRFYDRYDSHISDYFFFNMSGTGAGFRNLDLGDVKLSYSYLFDHVDPSTINGSDSVLFDSHDIRLSAPTARGEWTLFANTMTLHAHEFTSTVHTGTSRGYALGGLYKDKKITQELFGMEGENVTGLFYGEGVAKGAGSVSPYYQDPFVETILQSGTSIEKAQTWRFINYNDFANDTWGMMSNLVYETRDEEAFSGLKQTWLSAGVRPYWFLHRNARLVTEVGIDRVDDKINDTTYLLSKTTLALEAALDKGLWKRPVIRVYYTHANWSNNAKGLVGGDYYADQTHGNNLGVQFEYWW